MTLVRIRLPMTDRINPLRFDRAKPVLVVVEVLLGAFFLSWGTGLIVNFVMNEQTVPSTQVEALSQTVVVVLLMGVVLFFDGLRRGRRWL